MSVLWAASLHLMVKPSCWVPLCADLLSAQPCIPAELAATVRHHVSRWLSLRAAHAWAMLGRATHCMHLAPRLSQQLGCSLFPTNVLSCL